MNELDKLNIWKKQEKKEAKELELSRNINLVKTLGENPNKFRIIDEMPMDIKLVEEFELAIKSGVPGRPPKVKVVSNPTFGDKYQVMYRYDLRISISGPKILPDGRTRPFCEHILEANRFYTRDDIDKLSNGFGLSVFKYSGGWYTNPDTGETTPMCRHNWLMMFVERK